MEDTREIWSTSGVFLTWSTRTSHLRIGRTLNVDAGEMGALGYVLFGLQVVAFALGGFATFCLILDLPACAYCPSFLRKVRQTSNGEIPVELIDKILGFFQGNFDQVQSAIAWRAPKDEFSKKERRGKVT